MAHRFKARRILPLIGVLLTVSSAYGEEPRVNREAMDTSSQAHQARKALVASIPRRELELSLRQRRDVLVEVAKRIEELGLSASAEELTSLLEQRAYLEIDIDKCLLGLVKTGCRSTEAELAAVEASFQGKAGLSTREFRGGRRDTPGRDAGLAGRGGSVAKAAGDTCTCAFTVSSLDRWMSPYWGLECNNHASHGFCSNNLDSAHSPGAGAMTGDIDLYFGSHHVHRDCPDDHRTCFQGPGVGSSSDDFGQWGNTCSCDTWHSQYYNPTSHWYGGDLTHSPEVWQLSTGWLTVGGACNEVYVSVREFIQENDPWCCDDPMGTLAAYLPLANGYGTTSGAVSAQNCNGGSQSGRYPYCGTFGATIRVTYNCQTYSPPPPPTCDPQAEADCWALGWQWDSYSCSCQPPQEECEPYLEQQSSWLKRPPLCEEF